MPVRHIIVSEEHIGYSYHPDIYQTKCGLEIYDDLNSLGDIIPLCKRCQNVDEKK